MPTPVGSGGRCDTSIVEDELANLSRIGYSGQVILKSTVAPGTTTSFCRKFENLSICFSPEFLRERSALADLKAGGVLIIGGGGSKMTSFVRNAYGLFFDEMIVCTREEAELIKYFHNTFNALRIVFANQFFDLCGGIEDASYDKVLSLFCKHNNMKKDYLRVSDEFRGYSGPCLPKDTKALAAVARELGMTNNIWDVIDRLNANYPATVFEGMRTSG